MRMRDVASNFMLQIAGFVGAIISAIAWLWFESLGLEDLKITSGIIAFLSMALGGILGPLRKHILEIKSKVEQHSSKVQSDLAQYIPMAISYQTALVASPPADHSLPRVANHLWDSIEISLDLLSSTEKRADSDFFNQLYTEVDRMQKGDRLLAVCGRKFWNPESKAKVARYWDLNKKKAAEGANIFRAFVSDLEKDEEGEFSSEIEDSLMQHRTFRESLSDWLGESGERRNLSSHLQIAVLSRNIRDQLRQKLWLDPKFGFAIISRRETKIVTLHRLHNGHLRGSLIYDPLIYAIFEKMFWDIWKAGDKDYSA